MPYATPLFDHIFEYLDKSLDLFSLCVPPGNRNLTCAKYGGVFYVEAG